MLEEKSFLCILVNSSWNKWLIDSPWLRVIWWLIIDYFPVYIWFSNVETYIYIYPWKDAMPSNIQPVVWSVTMRRCHASPQPTSSQDFNECSHGWMQFGYDNLYVWLDILTIEKFLVFCDFCRQAGQRVTGWSSTSARRRRGKRGRCWTTGTSTGSASRWKRRHLPLTCSCFW